MWVRANRASGGGTVRVRANRAVGGGGGQCGYGQIESSGDTGK